MDVIVGVVGMQALDASIEDAAVAENFMASTRQSLNRIRKDDILSLLLAIGKRKRASLRKGELVEKVLKTQEEVREGIHWIDLQTLLEVYEEARMRREVEHIKMAFYKALLDSCVMKPLVATAGTKEGNLNEIQVLKAIP